MPKPEPAPVHPLVIPANVRRTLPPEAMERSRPPQPPTPGTGSDRTAASDSDDTAIIRAKWMADGAAARLQEDAAPVSSGRRGSSRKGNSRRTPTAMKNRANTPAGR